MSMGNELWGSKEEINRMMGVLKAHDSRHLYTQGSNNHQFVPSVLPNDDFFSGVRFSKIVCCAVPMRCVMRRLALYRPSGRVRTGIMMR